MWFGVSKRIYVPYNSRTYAFWRLIKWTVKWWFILTVLYVLIRGLATGW